MWCFHCRRCQQVRDCRESCPNSEQRTKDQNFEDPNVSQLRSHWYHRELMIQKRSLCCTGYPGCPGPNQAVLVLILISFVFSGLGIVFVIQILDRMIPQMHRSFKPNVFQWMHYPVFLEHILSLSLCFACGLCFVCASFEIAWRAPRSGSRNRSSPTSAEQKSLWVYIQNHISVVNMPEPSDLLFLPLVWNIVLTNRPG